MSSKRKGGKFANSPASAAKKKKQATLAAAAAVPSIAEGDTQDSVPSPAPSVGEDGASNTPGPKVYAFKDPTYCSNKQGKTAKKGKGWKNLKQIVQQERTLTWQTEVTLYSSIDAPPSFKPAKKYSDISGLASNYTDPHTKLRFASSQEYSRASLLPSDITTGLLTLRKAHALVP